MRDRTFGDTIYIAFSTKSTADVPTTLSGSPVISAYENASTTQITSGISLSVDHDSIVGFNLLTIVATGANGFTTANDYALVVTTGTVDSVSYVGTVVGSFSLDLAASLKAVDLLNDVAETDIVSSGSITTSSGTIDIGSINGSSTAATQLALSANVIVSGAAIAGTLSTTQMTSNLTETTDDHYVGRTIIWTSGDLLDQATDITDYTGATKLFTYSTVTDSPSAADTFIIV